MRFSKLKFAFLSFMTVGIAWPQMASAQNSAALSGLYACEAITEKDAQLACFLAETAKLRARDNSGRIIAGERESLDIQQQSLTAEKERLALEKSRLEADKKRVAALEKAVKEKANPPQEQTFAIADTSKFGSQRFIRFTLENGEVWQQTEAGYVRLGRKDPDMITIKRSSFGGYFAKVNGKSPSIRLKQIE